MNTERYAADICVRTHTHTDDDRQTGGMAFGGHAGGPGPKELSTGIKMLVSNLGSEVTDEDLEVRACT